MKDNKLNQHNITTVIIVDADKDLALNVIRCIGRSPKHRIILITNNFIPAGYSRYCHKLLLFNHKFDQELVNYLIGLSKNFMPVVLFPTTLDGFKFLSRYRTVLSDFSYIPPIPSIEMIERVSDKWKLYNIALEAGIPVLPSYLLSKKLLYDININELSFPLLVKTRNRKGGFGFKDISNKHELESICLNLSPHDSEEYIVQSYIDSIDYSLSVYCEDGRIKLFTLWKALLYGGRKFSIPRVVKFVNHEKVLNAGEKLMKTIQWNGVADIDFIVENGTDDVSLLEVNARFWQTVPACLEAGINFPEIMYRAALKCQIPENKQIDNTVYARPSAIADLLMNRWPYGHAKGILNSVKSIYRLMDDPFPEISQLFQKGKISYMVHKILFDK